MFERFTEKARRIIFFARYEASQFGSPYIETEHLLLGLLREDKGLCRRFRIGSPDSMRQEVEQHTTLREKTATSIDLPLSNESKRVLGYAAEEADRLNHKHIGTEHLLLGLLREKKSFAAELLSSRGVKLEEVREDLARTPHEIPVHDPVRIPSRRTESSTPHLVPLTPLNPLVGRESELERVLHVLGCRNSKNPVLVGELGVGKRTIVGGLAQRISDYAVPAFLADASVLELNLPSWDELGVDWFDRLRDALPKGAEQGVILFVDELHTPVGGVFGRSAAHLHALLKRPIVSGQVQCISIATPAEYAKSIAEHGWLESCFQPIRVAAASEDESLHVLRAIKATYEGFHGATYSDEVLAGVVAYAACIPDRRLPGKAVDLMDEAGSVVRLRYGKVPEEVQEVQKRVRFIVQRMQAAIANHEFEKARFYSEEERKERENLQNLLQKYKAAGTPSPTEVTVADIEGVIANWTGATIEAIRKARRPPTP